MKLRNTLILLAVAAGLVLFIAVFEQGKKSRGEIIELEKFAFPKLNERTKDATAIEIVRGPEKLVLVKRDIGTVDEHWQITQPIDYRADRSRVEGFLGAFERAEKTVVDAEGSRQITLSPGDPVAEYKLDKETAVQVMIYADKEKLLDAIVGGLTATKDNVYVAQASREAVYVVGDLISDEARRYVDEFRDKHLLALKSKGMVAGITLLEDDKPKAVLAREKGKPWHLTAPLADRASQGRASAIIDRMDSLYADVFVVDFAADDPRMAQRMADYGLIPAKKSVKFVLERSGQVSTHEVLFGNLIKKHETGSEATWDVYAMIAGSRTVTLVPAGNLDPLAVSVDDLRDRNVLDFRASAAVAVKLDRPTGELRFEKKAQTWEILGADKLAADQTRVREFIEALVDLKVEKFLPPDTELKTPIRVEVACEAKDSNAPSFGGASGEKDTEPRKRVTHLLLIEVGGGDNVRARRGDRGTVFEVKRSILEKLTASALHFRTRRVLEFDEKKIATLAVTVGGKTDAVTREEGKWKLDGDGELDPIRTDTIKWDMSKLDAEEFVGNATDAELRKYGLAPPEVRVEVTLKPDRDPDEEGKAGRTYVLLIGKVVDPKATEDAKRYYARLSDNKLVFLLSANALKDVRMGLVKQLPDDKPAPDKGGADAGGGVPAEDAARVEE
jgi:hypothetical protein